MSKFRSILSVTAACAIYFASFASAAEGPTSGISATPKQNRQLAKSKDIFLPYSTTTDVDLWLTFGDSPRTTQQHIRVNYANLGNQHSFSREYVLVFTSANHTLLIFENETGSLAPGAGGSKVFVIPKKFVGNGSVVEVVLLEEDDNPNNNYDIMVLPSQPGI